ncbi:hypothetical protein G4B88_013854 [Cannabis sativa]|uniref:NB-ARC domain-containing protein n=1 Tax=Cannabis sativa TaxID=3483 RepID=A0A7J6I0J7_CANSA|nr:hypothetical protein G4B88_013854 [Cannabis sativa]
MKLSYEILKKYRGLPLAIGANAIAGLLSRKKKVQFEWKKVLNDIDFEFKTNPQLVGIFEILSLSYVDLPFHLKSCLLRLFTSERKTVSTIDFLRLTASCYIIEWEESFLTLEILQPFEQWISCDRTDWCVNQGLVQRLVLILGTQVVWDDDSFMVSGAVGQMLTGRDQTYLKPTPSNHLGRFVIWTKVTYEESILMHVSSSVFPKKESNINTKNDQIFNLEKFCRIVSMSIFIHTHK